MNPLRTLSSKAGRIVAGLAVAASASLATAPAAHALVNCGCRPVGLNDPTMVFTRSVNGFKQVFKADQNLTHVTQLTTGNVDNFAPSFDSARTLIAYTTMVNKHRALFVMNADGTNQHNVESSNVYDFWSPTMSPDGSKVVVVSNQASGYELFSINVANGAVTQLTTLGVAQGDNWAPAWSPNGQYIAFTSDRSHVQNIYEMSAGGGNAQRVTYDGGADNAAWSPNGQEVAYDFLAPGAGQPDVYWADAFSVNVVHKVSTTDGTAHFDPTWSPDGSSIAFTSGDSSGPNIKAAGINGDNEHSLLNPGFMPSWGFPIQGPVAHQ